MRTPKKRLGPSSLRFVAGGVIGWLYDAPATGILCAALLASACGDYGGGSEELHGVLSPYDGLSRGIITALQNAGYGTTIEEGLPVVTGQDAEIASVKLIADDVQFATIFKDTRKLADQAVVTAEAYLAGEEPEANDTETYDNGVKVVPSYLLESTIVYQDNIESALVETGYYTPELEKKILAAGAQVLLKKGYMLHHRRLVFLKRRR